MFWEWVQISDRGLLSCAPEAKRIPLKDFDMAQLQGRAPGDLFTPV